VKPQGTRHSFSTIADTTGEILSMQRLNKVLGIDREAKTVTIQPGITYGQLGPLLDAEGFALPNMASLPHISVVGACSTATHGSGVANQMLSCSVRALELVNGAGELIRFQKEDPRFGGAVVGLGGLGIVTQATLDLVTRFDVAQTVYEWLPLEDLRNHFMSVMSAGYSVSLFYDWQNEGINQVWVKRLSTNAVAKEPFFGARSATEPRHPLAGLSAENCTEQMGRVGSWYERLPHFRLDFTPSNGAELQTEYFVPLERGLDAIEAVRTLRREIGPLLQVSEIRTVAADNLWLSPAYHRDSLGIHFTWRQDWEGVRGLLPRIEAVLRPFGPRPHWGKLFTTDPSALREAYDRLPSFVQLAESLDPSRKFRNAFLDANIFS
jgi:xylitol oxidase